LAGALLGANAGAKKGKGEREGQNTNLLTLLLFWTSRIHRNYVSLLLLQATNDFLVV
jgi:hypothetical protein